MDAIGQRPFAEVGRPEKPIIRAAAMAAPFFADTPPWCIHERPGGIDFVVDADEEHVVNEWHLKTAAIACAAAALNAEVALRYLGYGAHLRLTPSRSSGLPTICLEVERRDGTTGIGKLFPFIHLVNISRAPFKNRPIPTAVLDALETAAAGHRTRLRAVTGTSERQRLMSIMHVDNHPDADVFAHPPVNGRWLSRGGFDSVPTGEAWDDGPTVEAAPVLAVLATPGDEPTDWLRAGMALQQVLLHGTADGLAFSLPTGPWDLTNLRWLVSACGADAYYPQMLIRIGYA